MEWAFVYLYKNCVDRARVPVSLIIDNIFAMKFSLALYSCYSYFCISTVVSTEFKIRRHVYEDTSWMCRALFTGTISLQSDRSGHKSTFFVFAIAWTEGAWENACNVFAPQVKWNVIVARESNAIYFNAWAFFDEYPIKICPKRENVCRLYLKIKA